MKWAWDTGVGVPPPDAGRTSETSSGYTPVHRLGVVEGHVRSSVGAPPDGDVAAASGRIEIARPSPPSVADSDESATGWVRSSAWPEGACVRVCSKPERVVSFG